MRGSLGTRPAAHASLVPRLIAKIKTRQVYVALELQAEMEVEIMEEGGSSWDMEVSSNAEDVNDEANSTLLIEKLRNEDILIIKLSQRYHNIILVFSSRKFGPVFLV